MVTFANDVTSDLVMAVADGPFSGKFTRGERPVCMQVNGVVTAMILADEHLTSDAICQAYANWTGLARNQISCSFLGHNYLRIRDVKHSGKDARKRGRKR